MNINVLRGTNQIGGNIVEIASNNTRILFDVGLELDADKNKNLPEVDGIFDYQGYDAIFISHYHSDHMGLAYNSHKDIPIYIGEDSYKIVKASDTYKQQESLKVAGFLKHKTPIHIGDITVTPFLCDHSAFDSYMLLAEGGNEKILYTGDFRSSGRKPYEWLLKELPSNIDKLICEGTTLSRTGFIGQTESDLERQTVDIFKRTLGPIFILQSSMNIDRIVTMYRSAIQSNRIFLEDLYMAEITSSIRRNIPNPIDFEKVKVFVTRPYPKEHNRYLIFNKYGKKKISKQLIARSKYVMCIRSSMLNYLKSLSQVQSFADGLLVYSFWSGYKEQPEMKVFLEECEELGLKIVALHTSGHADDEAILKLVATVKPKEIWPIHTENADWFRRNSTAIICSIGVSSGKQT